MAVGDVTSRHHSVQAPDPSEDESRIVPSSRVEPTYGGALEPSDWQRFHVDTARSLAMGTCDAAVSCKSAHLHMGRRLLRRAELPRSDMTVDEAAEHLENTVRGWVRERPIYGVPLYSTALVADGFDLDVRERWSGGEVRVGLDVGSFGSDFDVFARVAHRFNDETGVAARTEYDVQTGVYGGALELIHHRRDGRLTLAFHAGASSEDYQIRRTVTQWPANEWTTQWGEHPRLTIEETRDEVRYRIGMGVVYRFGDP